MNVTLQASQHLVIDASTAVWAVVPVLAGSKVDLLGKFRDWRVQGVHLVVPSLWLAECTSSIRRGVYARVISEEEARQAVVDIFSLDVDTLPMDQELCQAAIEWAARLGQSRAYDAFYIALAEKLGAELWTADSKLANGARQAGAGWVRWVGER
jgi:predicted nucleic acid-binding protein